MGTRGADVPICRLMVGTKAGIEPDPGHYPAGRCWPEQRQDPTAEKFLLAHEAARTTPDPRQNVLSCRQSTGATTATLLDWNRAALAQQ